MNIYKSRYQYSRFDRVEIKKLVLRLLNSFKGEKIDDDATMWSDCIMSDEIYTYTNQREFLIELIDYDKIPYSWENNLAYSFPTVRGYYVDFKIDGDPVDGRYKEFFKKFVKLGSFNQLK